MACRSRGEAILRVLRILGVTAALSQPATAAEGFHGFVFAGVGYLEGENNLIKGNAFLDIGTPRISDFGTGPSSESAVVPALDFELSYGFNDRVEVFLGTSVEDFLTYDVATQAGVRTDMGALGTISVGYVFSSVATEVWEDPYLLDTERRETDQTSNGIQLAIRDVFQSGLGLTISAREVEVDNELSGTNSALGLTADEIGALRREGDQLSVAVEYRFELGDRHLLVPQVRFADRDREGKAETAESLTGHLTYRYTHDRMSLVGNLFVGKDEFDAPNPIFGAARDQDVFGIAGSVIFPAAWLGDAWSWRINMAYGQTESDIDFFDSSVWSTSLGLMTRW